MTNKDMFMQFANYDFQRVIDFLQKGYTETTEWKDRLEALNSSLDALLRDMDMNEKGELYA